MTPLRIVQINTVDVAGGAAKVARKLHEKFRERGHSSTLVVGWKQSSDPDVVEIDNTDAGRRLPRPRVADPRGSWPLSTSIIREAIAFRPSSAATGMSCTPTTSTEATSTWQHCPT